MRVSSFPPRPQPAAGHAVFSAVHQTDSANALPIFKPFSSEAFSEARVRHVPVFLIISSTRPVLSQDASLSMQISERTVPVFLLPGERPDIELLCQRAGLLFSEEGALPLCALLLDDARPFLAASLPPDGFEMDPLRLYAWLSHADRRFLQNAPAFAAQAAHVIHSFKAPPLRKPYSPQDAAHDLSRALLAVRDAVNGGFGQIKSPFVCALRFLQHDAARGNKAAHSALSSALDAMLSSALFDPVDGAFFRTTLTEDWRVFVPEKPLGVNAMLALCLLSSGRRSEAIRLLDFIADAFVLPGGGLSPALHAPKDAYSFTPDQVCAALGSEDGLRACRLLSLLHQHAREDPEVTPSRFSPMPPEQPVRRLSMDLPPRYPTLSASLTPEDAAFLRRALPTLRRARSARNTQQPLPYVITEHCALAAAVLALCGKRLGESRYTQTAQRAVSFLIGQPPAMTGFAPLPASLYPVSMLHAQAACGASAALALAQLILGQGEGMQEYAHSGLRLLGGALHAFVRKDGVVMHTPEDPAAFFLRVPAIYDSELPSPAALLVHALRQADALRPQAGYADAIQTIWEAAAPAVHAQPLACAALIDAMTEK